MRHSKSCHSLPADLVYQTDRRKVVYERLHPETVKGATGRGRDKVRNNCEANEDTPDRFTLATAKATGRSERAVQMAATIADYRAKKAAEYAKKPK